MRKNLLKATTGLALLALPLQARAESPSLAAFVSQTAFFSPGATFDVQFLYGIQIQNSSLWYSLGATGLYTQILKTTGDFPNETTVPAAGTRFNGLNGGGAGTLVTFALCNGGGFENGATTSDIAATCSSAPGPLLSGPGSTNVAVTSSDSWNAIRTTLGSNPFTSGANCVPALPANSGYGCPSDLATVFGFEDRVLATSDQDFSDVVFSTSLATVVPEPSTVLLTSAGLLGLLGAARRRKNQA